MRGRSFAAVLLLAAVCAGCTGNTNPVRDVFTELGAGPPATQAPAFVQQSRPGDLDYIPVQRAAANPLPAARSPEEIKKLEAELEAARLRNVAQGEAARRLGATPAPAAPRP